MGTMRRALWAVPLLAAALGVPASAATQKGAVRATLLAPTQPKAMAVFTGTLDGQTLRWRLTHHGLGPTAAWATLRVAGRTLRLCAPCASSRTGSLRLTATQAGAARSGAALVRLRGSGATISGKLALGTVPTLQLQGLSDGARLSLPATVHYTVTGVADSPRIVAKSRGADVPIQEGPQQGTFVIPDDKQLTGLRDLTFSLADSGGSPILNREATVRVYDVLLAGRR